MRAHIEWCKSRFDEQQNLHHRRNILLPGKMKTDRILMVARTHPEVICCDGTNLGYKQVSSEFLSQTAERMKRLDSPLTRHEVFGLKLIPGAGQRINAEVRQTLVPGTSNAK